MMRTAIFNDGENFRHNICDLFAAPSGKPFAPERHLFDRNDYLPKRANWGGFFDHLVDKSRIQQVDAYLARAYWYVVGAVDARPWRLPKPVGDAGAKTWRFNEGELTEWHRQNQRGIHAFLEGGKHSGLSAKLEDAPAILKELHRRKSSTENRFHGFAVLQSGIALAHGRIEFRRSGGIHHNLFTDKLGQEKTTDVNLAVDMMRLKDTYDIAVIVSGDQDFVPVAAAVKDLGKRVVNVSFSTKGGKMLPSGARRLNVAVDQSIVVDYDTFRKFLFPEKP